LVATEQRDLLLTIPRLKKANPPQHILRATNGDLLRGDLVRLDQESLQFQANQETLRFPREVVSAVIWLHFKPDAAPDKSVQRSDGTTPEELPVGVANAPRPAGDTVDAATLPADPLRQTVQVLVSGDRRLTFDLQAWRENQLIGQSAALGRCAIDVAQIEELRFGSFANQALDVPYSDWVASLAPEPVIQSGSDGEPGSELFFGSQSPLIGTEAPDLSLPLLDGETLSLQSLRGKVVVLDFWATWCSPCIRAIPDLMAATGEFSADDVILVAVNQEEDVATIKTFLANRNWALTVGLDNGALARRLQVQSLPQTVVIGPDGKIAFVKTGYTRDLRESLQRAIASLLGD
jgi:peroxiredoxin